MSDKRNVHTDALSTLGTIISENEKRDAIHLAVEPVQAGEDLYPSLQIGLLNGKAYMSGRGNNLKTVGIVDPFLNGRVFKDQWFWLVVMPRQITSLRHVWEHPDFANTNVETDQSFTGLNDEIKIAREWMEDCAKHLQINYEDLIAAGSKWLNFEGHTYENSEGYKYGNFSYPKYWKYFYLLTGKKPESDDDAFFTCSC